MIYEVEGTVARGVEVRAAGGSYPVLVGKGLLRRLPRILGDHAPADRVALVTDDQVGPLHGEDAARLLRAAGIEVVYLTFPAGEASKSRKSWSILTDEMLDAGLGRDTVVIALGGGVTTDLGGFVAATYMRGVPVVQVPTSYLAMIDASVGGKTGVDVRSGKNLVGAFHPPAVVVVDPEALETLPRHRRAEGLVEAFKHGAVLDAGHFRALESGLEALMRADRDEAADRLLESIRIKADVVSRDEFEGGLRQVLNFGHTIGHAIEAASAYTLSHGSAVALGMLAEAWIGEQIGVTEPGTRERLAKPLTELIDAARTDRDGAPHRIDPARALTFLAADKKVRAGRPRFVLLERLGAVSEGEGWTHEVPADVVEKALAGALAGV